MLQLTVYARPYKLITMTDTDMLPNVSSMALQSTQVAVLDWSNWYVAAIGSIE